MDACVEFYAVGDGGKKKKGKRYVPRLLSRQQSFPRSLTHQTAAFILLAKIVLHGHI